MQNTHLTLAFSTPDAPTSFSRNVGKFAFRRNTVGAVEQRKVSSTKFVEAPSQLTEDEECTM